MTALTCDGCGLEGVGVTHSEAFDATLCGNCHAKRKDQLPRPRPAPLPDAEVDRLVDSIVRTDRRNHPARNGRHAEHGRRVRLTPASDITPERVRWLEPGRVPLCGVVVVAGEPGLGKSTYTNAYLPAQVTLGTLDGDLAGEPRDVLVASAEDSWSAVIVPRLMAAGADLTRVHRIAVHDEVGEASLTLPDDVAQLTAEAGRLRDEGRPAALVVIDPIGAFLSDAIDSHRDASVRRALMPLADLAERERLAVGVVAHVNKDAAAKLLSRITGSGAFGAAARSVLGFARDPEDPDGDQGGRRVIVHCKSNWGRYAPTLAATVESRLVDLPGGDCADVGLLVVTGECDVTPESLQAGRDELDGQDVEETIAAALADGPRPSREVKATVKAEAGCSHATIKRAAKRMVDTGSLVVTESGFPRTTQWALAVGSGGVSQLSAHAGEPTEQTRIPEPETGVPVVQSAHVAESEPTEAVLLDHAERLLLDHADIAGDAA